MTYTSWAVGDTLDPVPCGQICRSTLGRFAGASGDYNPMHIDLDVARAAGHADVFAHGMLSMAFLGRALNQWVPQSRLRRFSTRFTAITPLYAEPRCGATVREIADENGVRVALLDLHVELADGTTTLTGEAEVELPKEVAV